MATTTIKPRQIAGGLDGWIPAEETWTYASATTITVPSGAASRYQKGMPFKLTANSVVLQGYIVGIADTVLTVAGDALTNHTFTNNYFAQSGTVPIGFTDWFAYTATITGFSSDPTMLTRFKIVGTACYFNMTSTTNGTSNATTYTVTLPVRAKAVTNITWRGYALTVDNGAATDGNWSIVQDGTVLNFFDGPLSGFTTSGNKSANGEGFYEI